MPESVCKNEDMTTQQDRMTLKQPPEDNHNAARLSAVV